MAFCPLMHVGHEPINALSGVTMVLQVLQITYQAARQVQSPWATTASHE